MQALSPHPRQQMVWLYWLQDRESNMWVIYFFTLRIAECGNFVVPSYGGITMQQEESRCPALYIWRLVAKPICLQSWINFVVLFPPPASWGVNFLLPTTGQFHSGNRIFLFEHYFKKAMNMCFSFHWRTQLFIYLDLVKIWKQTYFTAENKGQRKLNGRQCKFNTIYQQNRQGYPLESTHNLYFRFGI